ncbi:hypothetical protein VULLAG_LOCUS21961 [Vulpes lagopus]
MVMVAGTNMPGSSPVEEAGCLNIVLSSFRGGREDFLLYCQGRERVLCLGLWDRDRTWSPAECHRFFCGILTVAR